MQLNFIHQQLVGSLKTVLVAKIVANVLKNVLKALVMSSNKKSCFRGGANPSLGQLHIIVFDFDLWHRTDPIPHFYLFVSISEVFISARQ